MNHSFDKDERTLFFNIYRILHQITLGKYDMRLGLEQCVPMLNELMKSYGYTYPPVCKQCKNTYPSIFNQMWRHIWKYIIDNFENSLFEPQFLPPHLNTSFHLNRLHTVGIVEFGQLTSKHIQDMKKNKFDLEIIEKTKQTFADWSAFKMDYNRWGGWCGGRPHKILNDPELMRNIIARYKAGQTKYRIATDLGQSEATIGRFINKMIADNLL